MVLLRFGRSFRIFRHFFTGQPRMRLWSAIRIAILTRLSGILLVRSLS